MLLFKNFSHNGSIPQLKQALETYYRSTGVGGLFPRYALPETDDILEADMLNIALQYNYAYLPDAETLSSLLYTLFICRWHTSTTHFTKRSGWKIYQLIYTQSGAGILNLDHRIYRLEPESLCLLNCSPYHYYFADSPEGWEYSFILFSGNSSDLLGKQIEKKGILHTDLKGSEIKGIYDTLLSLAQKEPPDFDLLFHRYLTDLLVAMARSHAASPQQSIPAWLSEIQAYIIENYNREWTIRDLAAQSYLSESRFAHMFKEVFGSSPMEYRDFLRMEHAKEYLRNSSLSIEKIGDLVGYHNLSNFYARFSKHTGVSPGRYRRQNREDQTPV